MKTVLVTGANGQLGSSIHARISQYPGYNFLFTDIDTLDICDKEAVRKYVLENDVQYVMNCAAYTAVDKAEEHEDLCMRINRDAVRNLGEAAHAVGAKVIHVSTDYVFAGDGTRPYVEYDIPAPISAYGRSKYEGEKFVQQFANRYFIVRTAWLYGDGKNFVKTMLKLSETHDELSVVDDQVGSPTYTYDLSRLLVDMAEKENYGRYHATNEGLCSWYEFACEIFKQAAEIDPAYGKVSVSPVSSDQYPAKAKRPSNSRMSKEKLTENGFEKLPTWQDALHRYLREIEF